MRVYPGKLSTGQATDDLDCTRWPAATHPGARRHLHLNVEEVGENKKTRTCWELTKAHCTHVAELCTCTSISAIASDHESPIHVKLFPRFSSPVLKSWFATQEHHCGLIAQKSTQQRSWRYSKKWCYYCKDSVSCPASGAVVVVDFFYEFSCSIAFITVFSFATSFEIL